MGFSTLKTCFSEEGFRKRHILFTFFNLKVTQMQVKSYHVGVEIFNIWLFYSMISVLLLDSNILSFCEENLYHVLILLNSNGCYFFGSSDKVDSNANIEPSNLLLLNYKFTYFLTDALMLLHLNYWNVM